MDERSMYSIVGATALIGTSVTLGSIPLLPIAIGSVGIGALYGTYRIFTKEEREYNKMIEKKNKEWIEMWNGLGVKNKIDEIPQLINIWETDYGHIYSFINPIGLCSKDYENKEITIKEYIGCNKVEFEVKEDFLNIKTIEIELPKFLPFVLPNKKSDELIVELGVNEEGKKIDINFNKIHAWLVAGATGSGKSVCIHNILTQLYCNYSDYTDFYICDMKKTELNNYRHLKSTIEYADDIGEVENIVDELLKTCDDRHELFVEHNVKNLQQYNKKVNKKDRLNNIVFVVEECVRLISNKSLQAKLAELGFIARSAGIIILMTIQRATKNLLSPDIKASLLGKIGFKTINKINSQVIMDDSRLFEIKERGICCVSCDDISIGETMVRVSYLQEDKIDGILKKYCKYK